MLRSVNRWWVWGLLYLATIPAFALVYQKLPRPFYQATARFEPDVRRMPAALAESLSREGQALRLLRCRFWLIPDQPRGSSDPGAHRQRREDRDPGEHCEVLRFLQRK